MSDKEQLPKKLTRKQEIFVAEYLHDFNATQAAIRAGYSTRGAAVQAHRMLTNANISAAIRQRIDERIMSADEVLLRLGSMARADMNDFMDIEGAGYRLNLKKAKELGLTHLIKRVKDRVVMTSDKDGNETETHFLEIELHDARATLVDLGRYHSLFIDNQNTNLNFSWKDFVEKAGDVDED